MTGSQAKTAADREGVVSGFVLRLARESAQPPCTRETFAELLGVSLDTVAGWETGRRPLSAVRVGQAVVLRHTLFRVGAQPGLVRLLDCALEADIVIDYATSHESPVDRGGHPLGSWVMKRDVVELIAWPLTTRTPTNVPSAHIVRRGPSVDRPSINAYTRQRFFDHLRHVVEAVRSEQDALLRRQALYLLSFDRRDDAPS